MDIHCLEMPGSFALLAQAVVDTDQDDQFDASSPSKFKHLLEHPMFTWAADCFDFPGTFPEKVSRSLGVKVLDPQSIQVTQGLAAVANQQCFERLDQVPFLYLVKCKLVV